MATPDIPNVFVPGTKAEAGKVNANFESVQAFLANEVIHKDGSVALEQPLGLPAEDPTSDNQAARKAYVDSRTGVLAKRVKADGGTFYSGEAATDIGLSMPAFQMPTLTDGRALRICLTWPFSELLNSPDEGNQTGELWFRVNDGASPFLAKQRVGIDTTGFTPDTNTGGVFEYVLFDNVKIAAGTEVTIDVMAKLSGTGEFRLQSSEDYPIQFYAHIV